MRILQTLNSGLPGGMEQHVLDLVVGLVKARHEVHVWCGDGVMVKAFQDAGAKVYVKKVRFEFDPLYFFDILSFLIKKKIDVVHSHELKCVTYGMFAGFLARTKVRISHSHTPISEWQISKFRKKFNIFFYTTFVNLFSSYEIALTESRKKAKINEGIKESKIKIIPNGVDYNKFQIASAQKTLNRNEVLERYKIETNKFIFGNVSRVSAEKGHDTLIKAFHRLLSYRNVEPENIHLVIAGGGELESKMHKLINDLDIHDKVTITGRFPQDDQIKFYNTFDAFIFPSVSEGFGLVLLEALASGLPVICSNLEVLGEVGGSAVFSYFESGDYENLAEKMYDLYVKIDKLGTYEEYSLERVREFFSLDKFVDSYIKLYESINAGKS